MARRCAISEHTESSSPVRILLSRFEQVSLHTGRHQNGASFHQAVIQYNAMKYSCIMLGHRAPKFNFFGELHCAAPFDWSGSAMVYLIIFHHQPYLCSVKVHHQLHDKQMACFFVVVCLLQPRPDIFLNDLIQSH